MFLKLRQMSFNMYSSFRKVRLRLLIKHCASDFMFGMHSSFECRDGPIITFPRIQQLADKLVYNCLWFCTKKVTFDCSKY